MATECLVQASWQIRLARPAQVEMVAIPLPTELAANQLQQAVAVVRQALVATEQERQVSLLAVVALAVPDFNQQLLDCFMAAAAVVV